MDAAVAGASMGGCVALAFAGRYASRLTALGLFDTTAWYGADAPQQWRERGEKALSSGFPALVAFQKTRWFGDAFREGHTGTVDTTVATFLANDARAYAETCRMLGRVIAGGNHETPRLAVVARRGPTAGLENGGQVGLCHRLGLIGARAPALAQEIMDGL